MSGTRTIALSAFTSLLVSSLVLGIETVTLRAPQPSDSPTMPSAPIDALEEEVRAESPVIEVVSAAEPAVVSVIISKNLPVIERFYDRIPLGDSPFNFEIPRLRQMGTELQEVGGGTAFFVSEDGLLMTNRHVVSDEDALYSVLLNDGRTLTAKVLARDALTDIALLKVKGTDFPALRLSSSNEPVLGQTVIAIGNALAEFRNTVSVGVISGLQRTITAGNPAEGTTERLTQILQTDAAINQGNSGGPLLDLQGSVIGMNTAVASGAQNIGFAIPVSDLRRVLHSYQSFGRIVRPYLGVRYVMLTPALAEEEKLSVTQGALITKGEEPGEIAIVPDSPAAKADLREGDVIVKAGETALTEQADFSGIIQRMLPGDTLTLTILRDGREREVTVTLEEWTNEGVGSGE